MNAAMSYPGGGTSGAADFSPRGPSPTKPLWAVIGVLSMCVLAMGASLVSIHKRSAAPAAVSSNAMRFAGFSSSNMITESADGKIIENAPQPQENSARTAAKNAARPLTTKAQSKAATPATQPAPMQGNAPAAQDKAPIATAGQQPPSGQSAQPGVAQQAPVQAKPICTTCGTIEAVTPVTRPGKGSGVGMVAGGVLGAVVGNQVGSGNGRTAATVLGAVGGGWAGNAVEKNIKKDTVYHVRVRMQDGTIRTLEQASAPAVGSKVTVEGSSLRTSSGEVYAPAPAPEQRARAPQPQPQQRDVYNNGG